MEHTFAYLAISDPDTTYFNQSMKHPGRKEFLNVEISEVNSHCKQRHLKILPCTEVPKGQPILEYIWDMKRNR